jgi:hypothetical protein
MIRTHAKQTANASELIDKQAIERSEALIAGVAENPFVRPPSAKTGNERVLT